MIDLSNPEQVKAEAERRARLRAEGKPLTGEGGVARHFLKSSPKQEAAAPRPLTPSTGRRVDVTAAEHPSSDGKIAPKIFPEYSKPAEVVIGSPPIAWRRGDVLWLLIPATARPKKNSTMLGIRKSPGYIRFKHAVIGAVKPFAHQLQLPLPSIDYNCAAHFYREREDADTDNLMGGLADALQDAGVLEDDFRLRTWDGTDRFLDVTRPRVELTLTPYLGGHR